MPILGNDSSAGKKPTTPVIGTATDGGTGTTVSVPFTPSTYIGKGTITYTALSNPGSFSATSSGTPITVSGLTAGTAYTFTVTGNTNYGVASNASSASNSVTPQVPGAFDSLISTASANGTSNNIQLNNIPQTAQHLQLRCSFRTDFGSMVNIWFTINGDSGNNYVTNTLVSNGSGGSALASSGNISTNFQIGKAGGTNQSGVPGVSIIDIADYVTTNKNKSINVFQGYNGYTNGEQDVRFTTGVWNNAAQSAVNSISITCGGGNFATGTVIALYGIRSS